jgi:hypothetical protein
MSVVATSRVALLESSAALGQQLRALTSVPAALPLASTTRTPSGEEGHAHGRWMPGTAAAGAAALVGTVAALAAGSFSAKGDAPSAPTPAPSAAVGETDEQAAVVMKLRDWLASQGADLSKIDIKPSQVGATAAPPAPIVGVAAAVHGST